MLKIKIITVGKIKERSAAELIGEFEKRLGGYALFSASVIDDISPPKNPSAGEIEKTLAGEKDKIIKEINPRALKVALCVEGKKYSSEALAKLIAASSQTYSEIDFIIGSSHGLHGDIKRAADIRLSMSDMTFPHNIARLMLTEQVYRAFTMIAGTSYHK